LEGSTEPGGAAFGSEVHNALAGLPAGEAARELAASFTSSALGQRAASSLNKFNEFDFLIELDGHLLRGQIDLWFEDGGGVVLVDYKTDRTLDEARLARYSRQLRFYALALEKLNGRLPDEAWLFDLRGSKPHSVSLTRPDLDECLEVWRRFQSMRGAMEYPARPGAQCARCPYSAGACPSAQQS
jgi:CRISPR/Cas system-associated exonuclease Cas4 (RecB family)